MNPTIIELLTPLIPPLLLALEARYFGLIAGWMKPIVCALLGVLASIIDHYLTGAPGGFVAMGGGAILGAAGVGIREVISQLKQQSAYPVPAIRNPPDPIKPVPPAVPVLFLLALLSLALSGCATTGSTTTPATWAKVVAGTVDDLAASGVPPILDKNPSYAPLVSVVGLAIPAAFGASDLTPDGISATVASLGTKYGLPVAIQQLISRGVNRAVVDYGLLSGAPLVTGLDPNFKLILQAFGDGLVQGVKDWQARGPGANNPSTGINWVVPGVSRHVEGPYPVTFKAADGVNDITIDECGRRSETCVYVYRITDRPQIGDAYLDGDMYCPVVAYRPSTPVLIKRAR